MWLKLIFIFLFFCLAGIMQISFFSWFAIWNTVPNLILTLFFLIVFFESPKKYIESIFSAVVAGFILDIFSSYYFGISIILLLAVTFALKYVIRLLKKTKDNYPVIYFIPLYILFFLSNVFFLHLSRTEIISISVFLIVLPYNLFFGLTGFYIYKRFKIYEF